MLLYRCCNCKESFKNAKIVNNKKVCPFCGNSDLDVYDPDCEDPNDINDYEDDYDYSNSVDILDI